MVNRRQVVKFFTSHGFVNKGGTRHDRCEHPDGRWTVIERHKEINDRLFELMKKAGWAEIDAPILSSRKRKGRGYASRV